MSDKNLVRRALVEKAILDHLRESHEDTRKALAESLEAGDRLASKGLGYAQVTNPPARWTVTDRAAFEAWAKEVAPAFVKTETRTVTTVADELVKRCAAGVYIDENGEVHDVPGMSETYAAPVLRVVPDSGARERAIEIVRGGLLEVQP